MQEGETIDSLISEYSTILGRDLLKSPPLTYSETSVVQKLENSADWTYGGAEELVRLVNDYGSFMLRNALALAVVLGREDGERNF